MDTTTKVHDVLLQCQSFSKIKMLLNLTLSTGFVCNSSQNKPKNENNLYNSKVPYVVPLRCNMVQVFVLSADESIKMFDYFGFPITGLNSISWKEFTPA